MRDNFRPNVRLTTNILMVIGTFSIAFNLAPIAKESRVRSVCREGITAFAALRSGFDENYYRNRLYKLDRQFSKLIKTKKTGKSFANLRAVCPIYTKNDWKKLEEFYNNYDK